MSRISERSAFFAAFLQAVFVVLLLSLVDRTGLLALRGVVPLLVGAGVVSVLSGFRLRLIRLAEEERLEELGSSAGESGASLFAEEGSVIPFSAGKSRDQFERVALPFLGCMMAVGLLVCSVLFWNGFPAVSLPHAVPGAALAGTFGLGLAFILFLYARYLVGAARDTHARGLRGAGIWMGIACAGSVAVAAAGFLYPIVGARVDAWIARGLALVGGVLAVEVIVRLLMAWYMPGRNRRLPALLESALGALIVEPAAWGTRVAQTMDYQFGGERTTKRHLLIRTVVPLAGCVAGLLWVMTAFVFIEPHEVGVLERRGKVPETGWQLDPGFHFVAPWPIHRVERVPVERELSVQVGYVSHDKELPEVFAWEIPHYEQEDTMLVPAAAKAEEGSTPVALVLVNLPVHYRIRDARAYAYHHADPAMLLRETARRVMTHILASRPLDDVIGEGRAAIAVAIQKRLQADLDRMEAGIDIVFTGLHGVHPPSGVATDFQAVIGALEEKEALILQAKAYAAGVTPAAKAEHDEKVIQAKAYKVERELVSAAEVTQFKGQRRAAKAGGDVYRTYVRIRTRERAMEGARIYLVDHPEARRILEFDFEEKPGLDLFDFSDAAEEDEEF